MRDKQQKKGLLVPADKIPSLQQGSAWPGSRPYELCATFTQLLRILLLRIAARSRVVRGLPDGQGFVVMAIEASVLLRCGTFRCV